MNTFGRAFRITTFGESHGPAIGVVVDGCPPSLEISKDEIQVELDKRRPGQSAVTTSRSEEDQVEILSGLFEGKTLGTPITLLIYNRDADPSKYETLKSVVRPGHADYTWRQKFGHVDWRGGGRASARETAARVAAGAIAKKILRKLGIEIVAYAVEVAGIRSSVDYYSGFDDSKLADYRRTIESNPVRCIDPQAVARMEAAILKAKDEKDSVGGVIETVATGVPPGLGEPVFDKLGADIAKALLSLPAMKGVEIGKGFELARMRGSEANDQFYMRSSEIATKTNFAGGLLGGISSGMPIVARVALKPASSIGKAQKTVDVKDMKDTTVAIEGRHDPCLVPRAVPLIEAMMALVLADHCIRAGLVK